MINTGAVDARTRLAELEEAGEIHSLAELPAISRSRPALLPAEEEVSLPALETVRDPVLVTLARILGERLTSDNLAWRGDPVPTMRGLQKLLVAHSLELPESRREPAMRAIRVVELAVRWRLRWLQMKRSESESLFIKDTPAPDANNGSDVKGTGKPTAANANSNANANTHQE